MRLDKVGKVVQGLVRYFLCWVRCCRSCCCLERLCNFGGVCVSLDEIGT